MSDANKTIAVKLLEGIGVGNVQTLEAYLAKDVQVITIGHCKLSGIRNYDDVMATGKAFTK